MSSPSNMSQEGGSAANTAQSASTTVNSNNTDFNDGHLPQVEERSRLSQSAMDAPHPVILPRVNHAHGLGVHPQSPPYRRSFVSLHGATSPISFPRIRSASLGKTPLGCFPPTSPYAARSVPASPAGLANLQVIPRMPFLPPEHSDQRKAMEAAAMAERKRAKEMEVSEANLTADELRSILKKERHRMGRFAADLAAMRATAAQSQLEAELLEEGRINLLMRRMDYLQQEKGRIIVELESEEEMLTNTLQKKLDAVRREKMLLEEKIENHKKENVSLQLELTTLRSHHLPVAESLEEEEEMEEEA